MKTIELYYYMIEVNGRYRTYIHGGEEFELRVQVGSIVEHCSIYLVSATKKRFYAQFKGK